jgi:RNA-directed DNA polymerase
MIVVRYGDDMVVGFEQREEAEAFLQDVRRRFSDFGLQLHSEKTRLLEFGRFAAARRKGAGQSKPETFNFLGFTHICSQTRTGRFTIRRKTIAKRRRAKLRAIKTELRRRMHASVPETGGWLRGVLQGYYHTTSRYRTTWIR